LGSRVSKTKRLIELIFKPDLKNREIKLMSNFLNPQKCKLRRGVYREAEVKTESNGAMSLLLPEISEQDLQSMLPKVSVVTITKDRGIFAGVMLYNWLNIKYPRDKLEWVIVDDTDPSAPFQLREYISQDDPFIKFHHLDRWHPVAEKRNIAVGLANHEIIVHMDDDDYYFPDHVLAKVRLMFHYKVQGVHSLPIGVYDMMEKSSYIFDPCGSKNYFSNDVAEATLAYRKEYWEQHKFYSDNPKGMGEGRSFIGKRFHKWLNVHFMFNMISVTHSKNVTGHNRRFINENLESCKTGKFEDIFPPGFNLKLENVRQLLLTDYVQPQIEAKQAPRGSTLRT
jgi:glycosyltransferase involved in cell wall biosynthesis